MHLLGLVHKDIKPTIILHCQSLGNYVFCDYGVSEAIAEAPGYTSFTFREGTPKYMSK